MRNTACVQLLAFLAAGDLADLQGIDIQIRDVKPGGATMPYASPEQLRSLLHQWRGDDSHDEVLINGHASVFSAGVVLYEALTGELPFSPTANLDDSSHAESSTAGASTAGASTAEAATAETFTAGASTAEASIAGASTAGALSAGASTAESSTAGAATAESSSAGASTARGSPSDVSEQSFRAWGPHASVMKLHDAWVRKAHICFLGQSKPLCCMYQTEPRAVSV